MSAYDADGLAVARELIPARARKWLYLLVSAVGYVFGALGMWYASMATEAPAWLAGAASVAAFLLGPFGQLAATNVTPSPDPVPSGPVFLPIGDDPVAPDDVEVEAVEP